MFRSGIAFRILLSALLVLGQIGGFAHALSHLQSEDGWHEHASAPYGSSIAHAADHAHESADHAAGASENGHAHSSPHSDHDAGPICDLCAAFGSIVVVLSRSAAVPPVHLSRHAPADVLRSPAVRFFVTGAPIRAPPAVLA